MKKFSMFLIFLFILTGCFTCVVINKNEKSFVYAVDAHNVEAAEIQEDETLPEEYCLRDDYIIFTQNQGANGYCWDFAATLSATTTIMIATNEYYDFSELWTGITAYKHTIYGNNEIGAGGVFVRHQEAIDTAGLMLESDLSYLDSYIVSDQNVNDYYNFYSKYANDDLSNLLDFNYGTCCYYRTSNKESIKDHIINHGSLYLGINNYSNFYTKSNNVYYKTPNQTGSSSHAVSIIGWDDNFEKSFYLNGSSTATTFKGAWVVLNSWGEDYAIDGVSYIFYDDTNIDSMFGYRYQKDTSRDLYFYDKIESGFDYTTNMKGKYYGDFVAENNSTKQKNIFYDDVYLEYSYEISNGATIKSIDVYLDNINITDEFEILIDSNANRFYISKDNAEYGQHKVVITYGNAEKTDSYLNNFIVTHGLISYEMNLEHSSNNHGFNNGYELEYQSISQNNKNYVLYTNKLSGYVYYEYIKAPAYTEQRVYKSSFGYIITNGSDVVETYTITSSSGYELTYNFNIEYYEDTTLQNVFVFYDLGGGKNHSKNYHRELANSGTDLVLYEPTREGYTFEGWYLDYGHNSKKLTEINDLHYISWDDIHHMGTSPQMYATSHYNSYYKNSNTVFVYAHWEEIEYYDVDITINGGGTVEPDNDILISSSDIVKYNFIPERNYCLSELKINGIPIAKKELVEISEKGWLLTDVTEDMSIEATFIEGRYVLLNVGANIKKAYLTLDINNQDVIFEHGDTLPKGYFETQSTAYFYLVVEVYDDEPGFTYAMDESDKYTCIETGIYTKEVGLYSSWSNTVNTGDAVRVAKKYAVEYSIDEYVVDHYLSTDINATSGAQSGTEFEFGETVYLFIKVQKGDGNVDYILSNPFEEIGEQWYRREISIGEENIDLGTINVTTQIKRYTISVVCGNNGTVTPNGELQIEHGGSISFTFEADEGYKIDKVYVDDVDIGPAETYTFENVIENHSIEVLFSEITYTVTATLNGSGIVSPEGISTIKIGEDITYIFTANTGYHIQSIKVDDVALLDNDLVNAIKNGYIFSNISSDHTIRVEFAINTYTITIIQSENGEISEAESYYNYGSDALFTITPNYGFSVKYILIDGVVYTDNLTEYKFMNIDRDHTISAIFEKNIYTINAIANDYGRITPSGDVQVEHGDDKTFEFESYTGYTIDTVYVDNISIGSVQDYTFNDVVENHTIVVTFKKIEFTITAVCGLNGSMTPVGETNIYYGDSMSYTIIPNEGYRIKDVKVDGVSRGNLGYYYFVDVTSSHTIEVEFEIEKFNIIVSVEGQGEVDSDNLLENISYGDNRIFTISFEKNWELFGVFVDYENINVINNTFIVSNIDHDVHIQVIFKEKNVDITGNDKLIDKTILAIIIGSTIISILLIVLIIISNRKNKRKKLEDAMQSVLVTEEGYANNQTVTNNNSYQEGADYNNYPAETDYGNYQTNVDYINYETATDYNNYQESVDNNQTEIDYNSYPAETGYNNYQAEDSRINEELQNKAPTQNMQSNNKPQQNSILREALEFVKDKEQHFMSFCNRYNIDYMNEYNKAVVRYYQAYLRSLKK